MATVIGAAVAGIGLIDIAFAWYPLDFGRLEWEFSIISRTFDGLPLTTVGIGAVLAGLVARGSRRGLKAFAGLAALALLVLGVLVALYLMSAISLWGAASAPVKETLKLSFMRTGLFISVYLILGTWMSWFAWSTARSLER